MLKTGPVEMVCRRFPPTCFPIVTQNVLTGQPEVNFRSNFPPVSRSLECGEFRPRIEAVS